MEGARGFEDYAIIDDFVCNGDTVRLIAATVKRREPQAVCRAALFYGDLGEPENTQRKITEIFRGLQRHPVRVFYGGKELPELQQASGVPPLTSRARIAYAPGLPDTSTTRRILP
jgi:hypothetical protein